MPPAMPGYVGKGEIFKRLDTLLANPANRATFLQRISAKQPNGKWSEDLVDVLASMLPLSAKEKKHIEDDWFGEYDGWWPRQQPAEIICRLGMIQAIGLANGKKMDTYWVCGVSDFQFTSLVSDQQLTVLVFTPTVPASDQMPEDFDGSTDTDPIFTVRHRSRGPGEIQVQPDQEFCEFVQPRVAKH